MVVRGNLVVVGLANQRLVPGQSLSARSASLHHQGQHLIPGLVYLALARGSRTHANAALDGPLARYQVAESGSVGWRRYRPVFKESFTTLKHISAMSGVPLFSLFHCETTKSAAGSLPDFALRVSSPAADLVALLRGSSSRSVYAPDRPLPWPSGLRLAFRFLPFLSPEGYSGLGGLASCSLVSGAGLEPTSPVITHRRLIQLADPVNLAPWGGLEPPTRGPLFFLRSTD